MKTTMKAMVKTLINLLCTLLVLPLYLAYRGFRSKWLFVFSAQLLAGIPDPIGSAFRVAYYRFALDRCSRSVFIGHGSFFSQPNAEVGNGVYIGAYCIIGMARIEDDATIASAVHILSGGRQHGYKLMGVPIQEQPGEYKSVTIGANSWIGSGAIILADIGKQNVIAAGSVVAKSTGDYEVLAGNPAVVVKRLTS